MIIICRLFLCTHLSFGGCDGSPARVDLLIDAGQEVLGDS